MTQSSEVRALVAGCAGRTGGTWLALATQARFAQAEATVVAALHVTEPAAARALRHQALLAAHAGGWQHPGRALPELVMGEASLREAWLAGQIERLEAEALDACAVPLVRRAPLPHRRLSPRLLPPASRPILPRPPSPPGSDPTDDDPPAGGGIPPRSPYWPPLRF